MDHDISNKTYREIQDDIKRNPKNYLQPNPVYEPLSGRFKINAEFFKVYGNIFNKKNPKDIYCQYTPEQMQNIMKDHGYKMQSDADVWKITLDGYIKDKFKHTYMTIRSNLEDKECGLCSAINGEDSVLCWYCNNLLI